LQTTKKRPTGKIALVAIPIFLLIIVGFLYISQNNEALPSENLLTGDRSNEIKEENKQGIPSSEPTVEKPEVIPQKIPEFKITTLSVLSGTYKITLVQDETKEMMFDVGFPSPGNNVTFESTSDMISIQGNSFVNGWSQIPFTVTANSEPGVYTVYLIATIQGDTGESVKVNTALKKAVEITVT